MHGDRPENSLDVTWLNVISAIHQGPGFTRANYGQARTR
jgi:hypothetical protein